MTDWQPDNDTPATPSSDAAQGRQSDETDRRAAGQFGDVRADRVELTQGGASTITAGTVTVSQGGAGRVRARQLSIRQGGVGLARVDRLVLNEHAGAFAVLAKEATVGDSANVLVLIAGRTYGPVRTAIDLRVAAAFGAAFALVLALLRR